MFVQTLLELFPSISIHFFLPDTGRCCHQGSRWWKRTWKRNLVIDGSKVKAFIISVCWFSFTFSTKKSRQPPTENLGLSEVSWGVVPLKETDMFRVGCLVSHSVLGPCSWKPGFFFFLNLHLLTLNNWFKCRHALTHSSCTFCLLICQNSLYFHVWPPGGSHAPTSSAWTNRSEKRLCGPFNCLPLVADHPLFSSCCIYLIPLMSFSSQLQVEWWKPCFSSGLSGQESKVIWQEGPFFFTISSAQLKGGQKSQQEWEKLEMEWKQISTAYLVKCAWVKWPPPKM